MQVSKKFLSSLLICIVFISSSIAAQTQVLSNTTVQVIQEVPTRVVLSNTDINRITCPAGELVKDVIYSEEKAVNVKIEGGNAFVKFLVGKDIITGEKKERVDPVEFYVVCGDNDVFTIISMPKKIPAQHVQLVSKQNQVKKNLSLFEGIPFEKRIIMMCQKVYTNDIPDSFTIRKIGKAIAVFKDIDVVLNRVIIAEGEGIRVKEYILSLKESSSESLELAEKSFLVPELAENPVAIALESHTLKPSTPRRLFILEQNR
ncbi:MAG: type-F conjugative transfer system secretin TraK [Anaerohalosphaeraceae bacterium]|nr:type-F conjugative transfer system secretin TraK [Anaerohalosphaeraceae bacterium]